MNDDQLYVHGHGFLYLFYKWQIWTSVAERSIILAGFSKNFIPKLLLKITCPKLPFFLSREKDKLGTFNETMTNVLLSFDHHV